MKLVSDIQYSEASEAILDIYLADKSKSTLVYFHGGGIEEEDKLQGAERFIELAKNGITVLSVDYRMYPKAKYPEFLIDCADSVKWAFENAKKYGYSDKIFVGGVSAGAYLAMMICFDKKYFELRNIKHTDIAGFIFDAGQPTVHFNVIKERGIDPRKVIIDEAAPLYHIDSEIIDVPMLIIVADNDIKSRLEQTQLFYSTLQNFDYDMNKIELKIMQGRHTQYCSEKINGKFIYVDILMDFINKD